MQLPEPEGSQAQVARYPKRVVINCRLADPADPSGRLILYSVGPNRPEPLAVISDRLAVIKRESPDTKVIVRADRRLHYVQVRAVMRVVADCGIEMLNVVAHVSDE